MPKQPSLAETHAITTTIGQADTARAAATALAAWLGTHIAPAMIGLLDSASATLENIISPGYLPDETAADWMQSPDSWYKWQSWHDPRWLDSDSRPAGLEALATQALLVPLRYEGSLYGLLWLETPASKAAAHAAESPVLGLANLLAARLHHLQVNAHWNTLMNSVNTFSRALFQDITSEDVWVLIHDQLFVLFDASSFYVGLLNSYTNQLTLPLYSENGVQIYYGSIALSGLNKAVIQHGLPLHFRDLETELARLESLNVTFGDEEPVNHIRSWMGVPLRNRRNEVIGLISIQNDLPNSYTDSDLHLLLFVAGQIAFAVEGLKLFQVEQERRKIASTLMEVSQVVNASLHYEDVLENILEQVQRVVNYDSATIMLPAIGCEDGSRMVISAVNGASISAKGKELFLNSSSPGMLVFQSQQPLVISDIQEYPGWNAALPTSTRARSWMGVPMSIKNQVIGLITLDKISPNYYTESDASTVFALARQAAIAVENARLHDQVAAHVHSLEQRNRRLASMHSISTMLSASLEREVVLTMAAQLLQELFDVDHCGIVLINPKDGNAYLAAEYPNTGNIGLRIPTDNNPIFEQLAQSNRALPIYDSEDIDEIDDDTRSTIQRVGAQSTLLVSMFARNQLLGSIGLDMTTERRVFSIEEQETFVTLAAQVALAISNAQLYEEAIAVNRLKSELLANMSHELRTPLNAIIGYSEMLLSEVYGELNPKQFDRLSRVHSGGKHLLNLINDVLDLSKIETGQMSLVIAPLSISDIVYDVMAEFSSKAQAKGLAINLNINPDLPPIRADALRIHQILSNLVDNAIKFTETGSVTITVITGVSKSNHIEPLEIRPPEALLADSDWLAVTISDTGVGISQEDQNIIFDAFRQVDGSSIRRYEGTGLGLTIAQQLVKMHGGYIWAESQPGQGSTFRVLLPYRSDQPEALNFELPVKDPERPLVLVIDDDPTAVQLVQDYLSHDIYQVVGTTNSEEALELARKLQPAAIITDIMMPTVNGWEVLRALKSDSHTVNIPVVILSIVEQKTVGFYLGAADYLSKPISRDALHQTLERVTRIEPQHPILIIDDNADDRTVLADLLTRAGYPTVQVNDGPAALTWLEQQPASAILLDLVLPGLSGDEVLEKLGQNPATANIPVIAITGADFTAERLTQLQVPVLQKGSLSGNTLIQQIQITLNRSLKKRLQPDP
ncbi:MAG TPA: GAF domain-containing protein [Phototrophicaceae bacterium]|nr:GAF domain-containing protein [Phototrophicaceae bacterium]